MGLPGRAVSKRTEKPTRRLNSDRDRSPHAHAHGDEDASLMASVSYDDDARGKAEAPSGAAAPAAAGAAAAAPSQPTSKPLSKFRSGSAPRTEKFLKLLDEPIVNLEALRELGWSGIPARLRPLCWKLLLGYVPPNRDLREGVLGRKRSEYKNLVDEYYNPILEETRLANANANSNASSNQMVSELRQVAVDVPRTAPDVPFFHQEQIQRSLERILFIWGMRHPASGYVQGINDVATPFLAVFFYGELVDGRKRVTGTGTGTGTESTNASDGDDAEANVDAADVVRRLNELDKLDDVELNDAMLLRVEADAYWCLCKVLDGIQDHYTYAQPGIQKTLFRVGELVGRVGKHVADHLAKEHCEYMQFAFRWCNCLLLRELSFDLGIRLWDTYVSEGSKLKDFLVYVLSSFLLSWAPELVKMDLEGLIMFLQRAPTQAWTERDVETVLSRAYMWRLSFANAASHLAS